MLLFILKSFVLTTAQISIHLGSHFIFQRKIYKKNNSERSQMLKYEYVQVFRLKLTAEPSEMKIEMIK